MSEANEGAISTSEMMMDFSDHSLESFEEAYDYEPPTNDEGSSDEGNIEQSENESQDNAEASVSEAEPETFESLSESVGEESSEAESEDSSEASEDSQQAEGSEATGDVEEEPVQSLEELLNSGEYTVKAKVDGEEVDVTLAELKQNYAGKVAWDKKFTELSQEKQAYESEVAEVNSYINEFASKMREGDVLGAMSYFAEFGGVPPFEFKKQLIQGMLPEIQKMQQLSPEQIDLEYRQQEADYYRRQSESLQNQSAAEQARLELQSAEASVREAQMIDLETWNDASAHLKAHLEDPSQYSPELVRDFIVAERAENLIESVDASLLENTVLFDTVQSIIRSNPDFTNEDIAELLSGSKEEYVEKPKQEEVKQKVAKKVMESKPKAKEVPKQQFQPEMDSEGNEILDWEDLI